MSDKSEINTYRKHAIVTGILFLVTDVTAIVGLLLYQPLLNNSQFITTLAVSQDQILLGTLLEIILATAGAGTALVLYPILKKQNQSLALGYVIFRAIESIIILIGVMSILTVLTLRTDFLTTGGDAILYQTVGKALVVLQKWTFLFGPNIILPINATMLGYLLFKSKLVPRFISSLYLFVAPILFITSMGIVFGATPQTTSFAVLIAMPLLAFEILFSLRLIIKGFNQSALTALENKN